MSGRVGFSPYLFLHADHLNARRSTFSAAFEGSPYIISVKILGGESVRGEEEVGVPGIVRTTKPRTHRKHNRPGGKRPGRSYADDDYASDTPCISPIVF